MRSNALTHVFMARDTLPLRLVAWQRTRSRHENRPTRLFDVVHPHKLLAIHRGTGHAISKVAGPSGMDVCFMCKGLMCVILFLPGIVEVGIRGTALPAKQSAWPPFEVVSALILDGCSST